MKIALVVGAGPAGLMAAEVIAQSGYRVIVADQKPSFGRKFLMAGKSGLNLTKSEDCDTFFNAFGGASKALSPMLRDFGAEDVQKWAIELKQSLFVGSTGRVFPDKMKASPLLRAWLERLDGYGVERRVRWRWTGWQADGLTFETPDGNVVEHADVTVLALGGASWSKLGSDGRWIETIQKTGAQTAKFEPSNIGVRIDWTAHMAPYFGAPLKNISLQSGELNSAGEAVISSSGMEGGGVYSISRAVRDGHPLFLDLLPGMDISELQQRLSRPRGSASFSNFLRKTLKLDPLKRTLLREFYRELPQKPDALAALIKKLKVPVKGLGNLDEAISTAGGITWDSVDENLMLKSRPGVFVAGEMLDWEAPTGGYLLTACFATGRWAGMNACNWLSER